MAYNQVAQAQVLVAKTNFHTNLKKILNFLVANSGYQEPKSGSPSKFQVAWGYRATTKSHTDRTITFAIATALTNGYQ